LEIGVVDRALDREDGSAFPVACLDVFSEPPADTGYGIGPRQGAAVELFEARYPAQSKSLEVIVEIQYHRRAVLPADQRGEDDMRAVGRADNRIRWMVVKFPAKQRPVAQQRRYEEAMDRQRVPRQMVVVLRETV
jgi:hypothetical protein